MCSKQKSQCAAAERGIHGHAWAPAVLPDGNGGYTPCPGLLTEEEAIRYLRLDVNGPQNPSGTLKYYRQKGLLRGVRIGRNLRYPRKELDCMIDKLLERNEAFR